MGLFVYKERDEKQTKNAASLELKTEDIVAAGFGFFCCRNYR